MSSYFKILICALMSSLTCSELWTRSGNGVVSFVQQAHDRSLSLANETLLHGQELGDRFSERWTQEVPFYERASQLCGTEHSSDRVTVLFLHIFKAAGSSTRDSLKDFARKCGLTYRSCGSKCRGIGNSRMMCLRDGKVTSEKQVEWLRATHVMAGHLWYGLHRYVKNAVYVTCLRSPLDTAVSGKLYIHASRMAKLSDEKAAWEIKRLLGGFKPSTNFVKRLTGELPSSKSLSAATNQAIQNIRTKFAVVGVVAEYPVFIDMLRLLLDPKDQLSREFWEKQKWKRDNQSVKSTSKVLAILKRDDPSFVVSVNASLSHEWKIYEAGFSVYQQQAKRRGLLTTT